MKNNTHYSGLGLGSVLTIIFVVLKLVDVIDWNWWWVVSPALIEIGLDILFVIGFASYYHINHKRMQKKYNKKRDAMQRGIHYDD